jgi:hypothetical protein
LYPLWRAWRTNQRTTLRHAIAWAVCAWLAWIAAAFLGADDRSARYFGLGRYLALVLTGCTGVAVLGARRPVMTAWNFVVVALLAVLLWPLAEGMGEPRWNALVLTLLAAALVVGLLNYLPTRLAAATVAAAAACAVEACSVLKWLDPVALKWLDPAALALLAVAPWLGLTFVRRRGSITDAMDREWLQFRDRFGAVWALPARDQFNRAAAHAGWGVVLGWGGVRPAGAQSAEALAGLRAVLRRFRTDEDGE